MWVVSSVLNIEEDLIFFHFISSRLILLCFIHCYVILLSHILSCFALLYLFYFISFNSVLFHSILFYFISFYFISFYFISFYFISFYFISFYFLDINSQNSYYNYDYDNDYDSFPVSQVPQGGSLCCRWCCRASSRWEVLFTLLYIMISVYFF